MPSSFPATTTTTTTTTATTTSSSCVVFFQSTDPNLVDTLLQSLRQVFAGSAPLVRSTTSIHVFRPISLNPSFSLKDSIDKRKTHIHLNEREEIEEKEEKEEKEEEMLLYVFEFDGFTKQDGMYICSSTFPSKPQVQSPTCVYGHHILGFIHTIKNRWSLRQLAKIEGISLDLRDFDIFIGQLKMGSTMIGTLVHVTYKVPLSTPDLLAEFLQDYILVRPDLPTFISPMHPELMHCYVYVFRKQNIL